MGTNNYNLPTISGAASVKIPRDFNALAEATDAILKTELTKITKVTDSLKYSSRKGIYNLNCLRRIKNKERFSINVLGDSIAAGSNASNNFGFIAQLESALNVFQKKVNHSFNSFYYDANVGTWTKEETGINKHLLSSKDTSTTLQIASFAWVIPAASYGAKVLYSKRPDGGSFEIRESATNSLLATINCNGASEDGLVTPEYTIAAGNSVKIVPLAGNKAYVNGWTRRLFPAESSFAVRNLSQGGRKAKDFTDSDLVATVKHENPDLLIWELLANDFAGSDLTTYKQKTELAINTAKQNGADVLIVVTVGNSTSESGNFRSAWVPYLYEVAATKECALIDFDEMLGGYTKAQANGLMSDSIHPTNTGHLLMANALIEVLTEKANPYDKGVKIDTDDTRKDVFNKIIESQSFHVTANQYYDNLLAQRYDNNGQLEYSYVQPVISKPTASALPKYAPAGAKANVGSLLYVNTTDWGATKTANLATWAVSRSYGVMEMITTQPAASDELLGRLFRLEISGKDDQLVTYTKTSAGGRKWVKLNSTDPVAWT